MLPVVGIPAGIIPTGKVKRIENRLIGRTGDMAGQTHGASRIVFSHKISHVLHPLGRLALPVIRLVADFVAYRPDYDAGMIAIAHHQVANLFLAVRFQWRPAFYAVGLIVPFVKSLVPNDESHPVAQIQQLRRRRIVTGADGIYSHLAHDFQLPLHGTGVKRRPERPVIVVQIHAVKLHTPAVKIKTVVGREPERADAEGGCVRIHDFFAHANDCPGGIQLRVRDIPSAGIGNHQQLVQLA